MSEEFSGLAIIKMQDNLVKTTARIAIKLQRNVAVLDMINVCSNTVIFAPGKYIGVANLGIYRLL